MSMKALHCSFVRSILEYRSVVWNSHTSSDANQLKKVHRKFLRFSGFILKIPHVKHNYMSVANQLNLSSQSDRKRKANN